MIAAGDIKYTTTQNESYCTTTSHSDYVEQQASKLIHKQGISTEHHNSVFGSQSSKMEMSLYQDNDSDKTHHMKKTMQLDFGTDKTKQQKFSNMLQLASPELEKLISHNGMVGTTPTPSQFIYPKYVTDEQEAYARGFVEALAELHQQPGNYPFTSYELDFQLVFDCNWYF